MANNLEENNIIIVIYLKKPLLFIYVDMLIVYHRKITQTTLINLNIWHI